MQADETDCGDAVGSVQKVSMQADETHSGDAVGSVNRFNSEDAVESNENLTQK